MGLRILTEVDEKNLSDKINAVETNIQTQIGDAKTALDAIIAIQDDLIGGDGV